MYDCGECKRKNYFESRKCFKFTEEDFFTVKIPMVDDETDTVVEREAKIRHEDVIPILVDLHEQSASTPLFEIFIMFFNSRNGLCPVPFLDQIVEEFILLQDYCERYSTLPFGPGGTLDQQPAAMMRIFQKIVETKNEFFRFNKKTVSE